MYKTKEKYLINFTNIQNVREIHQIIKKEFDFPDYYGMNWDAFWDCITDLAGRNLNIEIVGLDKIYGKFSKDVDILLESLKDLKHIYNNKYENKISIYVHHGQSVVEID